MFDDLAGLFIADLAIWGVAFGFLGIVVAVLVSSRTLRAKIVERRRG